MSELQEILDRTLNRGLVRMILSNTRDSAQGDRARIRPVLIKGGLFFQETLYRGTQVFHSNYSPEEMKSRVLYCMETLFRQAQIVGDALEATVLVSKKGVVTVRKKAVAAGAGKAAAGACLSHNREKRHILQEGKPVDFLVGLGVQTPDGHVAKSKYDKFRQINRFLEFIEDILDKLPSDRTLRIVDFGCGKSYLTFAMYYYLHELQGRDIRVTGLDLKADVIRHCNELADKLGYEGLGFEQGDISGFRGTESVDMVVCLHACDKATDYALEKAVRWGARVIMAVPCCQHELNAQIRCDMLQPVLKYGLIRERMSALITDALRADILEQNGYDTQILEFIDMEHTPKNLMIRAVKSPSMRPAARAQGIDELLEFLQARPTLKELL